MTPLPGRHALSHALKAKVWTHPVIAHGRLYLRDQENLWCLEIRSYTPTSIRSRR